VQPDVDLGIEDVNQALIQLPRLFTPGSQNPSV
jgi:hypothetical protein